jgi:ribosome maturation factor RimP
VVFHRGDVILLPFLKGTTVSLSPRVEEISRSICEEQGLELVELDMFISGKRTILRVYLWKEGGVNVDDCSKFSREFGAIMDLDDVIEAAYFLEVSSPGVDRPLKTTRDFERNLQKFVKCTLGTPSPVDGRKVIIGELKAVNDSELILHVKDEEHQIFRDDVINAKVEIQF